MVSMNQVTLAGNLTHDPELKFIQSGTAVGNLLLAANTTYGKGENRKEETAFVQVTVWGKSAEWANETLKKGSNVIVNGRLQTQSWEKDGKKQSKLVLICERIQSCEKSEKEPADGAAADQIPF